MSFFNFLSLTGNEPLTVSSLAPLTTIPEGAPIPYHTAPHRDLPLIESQETLETERNPHHDHAIHFRNTFASHPEMKPLPNHTYLDHLNEMPPEVRDFVTAYEKKRTEEELRESNYTFGNETYVDTRAPWKKILDKTVTYIMTFNVIALMLGMGCAIFWRDVVRNLWPPIGVIIGMCGQFLILPATGFLFSLLFKLTPYEALGCLVVSCSPGGSFSNFFTYWVDGDLALSVVMTTFSSIIAFGGMPFNIWLYSSYYVGEDSQRIVIPYGSILTALALICGPVIVGMLVRHFSPKAAKWITKVTSLLGYILFLVVLVSWLILYWRAFAMATPLIYASAVILPVTGFILAYLVAFICRRTHKVCRTIGIETGSQNMPVALSIILLSFDNPVVKSQMLLFPTLYGIFMLCEVFLGIGFYRVVKYFMNKKKEPEFPTPHTARIENGTQSEKARLSI